VPEQFTGEETLDGARTPDNGPILQCLIYCFSRDNSATDRHARYGMAKYNQFSSATAVRLEDRKDRWDRCPAVTYSAHTSRQSSATSISEGKHFNTAASHIRVQAYCIAFCRPDLFVSQYYTPILAVLAFVSLPHCRTIWMHNARTWTSQNGQVDFYAPAP